MKKILSIICAALMLICFAVPVMAETFEGETASVVLTQDAKLESSFKTNPTLFDDTITEMMEPGDTAVFYLDLKNDYNEEVDFYMDRRTIDSLEVWGEDQYMQGGGYSYELYYEGVSGQQQTLFSSLKINGGSSDTGLKENQRSEMRTKTIDENSYIFLDTYAKGQGGRLVLRVSLDGESQGNDYQDTSANVAMEFAVELRGHSGGGSSYVKTGDTANLLPLYIAMTVAGLIILVLAIYVARRRKHDREEAK